MRGQQGTKAVALQRCPQKVRVKADPVRDWHVGFAVRFGGPLLLLSAAFSLSSGFCNFIMGTVARNGRLAQIWRVGYDAFLAVMLLSSYLQPDSYWLVDQSLVKCGGDLQQAPPDWGAWERVASTFQPLIFTYEETKKLVWRGGEACVDL